MKNWCLELRSSVVAKPPTGLDEEINGYGRGTQLFPWSKFLGRYSNQPTNQLHVRARCGSVQKKQPKT